MNATKRDAEQTAQQDAEDEAAESCLLNAIGAADELTRKQVNAWLSERLFNCCVLASAKTGADRDEWIDDARHFVAARMYIEGTR